jgi:DNA-binding SARP family transcriptional activator
MADWRPNLFLDLPERKHTCLAQKWQMERSNMTRLTIECKLCSSANLVRFGTDRKGNQRFHCKACGYTLWCHDLRLDLELKYHTALMNLAGYYASRKNYLQAVELLEKVVNEDSYNEEAQYQLIDGYLNANEPFAALHQLRRYSRICLEELGDDLSPRFVECHKRILKAVPKSA